MKLIRNIVILLIATLGIAILPTESEAEIYEDTLRLHILAASDSEEDQRIKHNVRDALLKEYSEILSAYGNVEDAKSAVKEMLPEIENFVNRFLASEGVTDTAVVTLTEEWYDTREYEGFTLPRGRYTSLRVIIGGGGGKNWWCVMFPPMCLDIATESAPIDDAAIGYTDEELRLINKGEYSVKFKLLELVSDAVAKLSKKG